MSNGKGSTQRPRQVSRSQYDANWEAVFGKKEEMYDEEALDTFLEDLANEKREHIRFLNELAAHDKQDPRQLDLPLKERK